VTRALQLVLAGGLVALLAGAPALVRAEEPPPRSEPEALVAAVAPAVVTLRFTLVISVTMGGQGGTHRMSADAHATVVDPSGLMLASDSATAGPRSTIVGTLESMMPGMELKLDIEELRIVLAEGEEELPGVLVVRDGRNDLAWIQAVDLGERRLPAVDLAPGRDPRVGEPLACVERLGRGFGYASVFSRARIASRAELPRPTWDVVSDSSEPGLLYFAGAGVPVAYYGLMPNAEGAADEAPSLRLLPLDVVRKSLEAAKKRVPEALAKARPPK
jgi:S1-C subfamily serine protease